MPSGHALRSAHRLSPPLKSHGLISLEMYRLRSFSFTGTLGPSDVSLCFGQKKTSQLGRLNAQMAGRTGLEPATSGVTGRRYNQLNYRPIWAPPRRRVSELLAILAPIRQ